MKPLNILFILVAFASIFSCKPQNTEKATELSSGSPNSTPSGNIIICGAYALYPLAHTWAEEYSKLNQGVTFTVEKQGTGLGLGCVWCRRSMGKFHVENTGGY